MIALRERPPAIQGRPRSPQPIDTGFKVGDPRLRTLQTASEAVFNRLTQPTAEDQVHVLHSNGFFGVKGRVLSVVATLGELTILVHQAATSIHAENSAVQNVLNNRTAVVEQIESLADLGIGVAQEGGVGPEPTASAVLLEDNFDDPDNGVLPVSSPQPSLYSRGYVDGEYVISRPTSGGARADLPGVYSDTALAIDVRFLGNPTGQVINLGTRKQPDGLDYRISLVDYSGHYLILQRFDSGREVRLTETQLPSGLFLPDAMNRLELGAVGDSIFAKVNGQVVAVAKDGTYQSGASWIGSWSGERSSGVVFDNLVVTQLDPDEPIPVVQPRYEVISRPEFAAEFRFDPDISEADRRLIEKLIPWTQEYWGEQAGFITVYAFRDIDSLIGVVNLNQRIRGVIPNQRLSSIRELLELESIASAPGALFIHISDEWASSSEFTKTANILHVQFHAIQIMLSQNYFGPVWLGEGGARYSMVRVMAENGLLDLEYARNSYLREAEASMMYSLDMLEHWSTISSPQAPYSMGFFATEYLVARFGEGAILSYWEELGNELSNSGTWQNAFENTFGISVADFYSEFDIYLAQQIGE